MACKIKAVCYTLDQVPNILKLRKLSVPIYLRDQIKATKCECGFWHVNRPKVETIK